MSCAPHSQASTYFVNFSLNERHIPVPSYDTVLGTDGLIEDVFLAENVAVRLAYHHRIPSPNLMPLSIGGTRFLD